MSLIYGGGRHPKGMPAEIDWSSLWGKDSSVCNSRRSTDGRIIACIKTSISGSTLRQWSSLCFTIKHSCSMLGARKPPIWGDSAFP